MRSLKIFVALILAAAGCGPEFAVVPKDGMDRVVAQMNGVTVVAFANQWGGDPYDLANYVTPIAVELYNGSPYEVRVNYADLALRDGSGFRYGAINPYIPATMVSERPASTSGATSGKPVLLAANGPMVVAAAFHGGGGGMHMSGGGFHGSASGGMRAAPRGTGGHIIGAPPGSRGWGFRGGGWYGYRPIRGPHLWYGWGGYWGGPWVYPPYYYDWVFAWGPTYYPARPSQDVLELGLPEGVLPPGARVSGFLYFKKATSDRAGALDLSWDVHDAQTGAPLGSLHVPLEVVHR